MLNIGYKPSFVRQFKKLELDLQDEVLEKIEVFKNKDGHKNLKVHKLHGKFADCFSFSVNFKIRVIFEYNTNNGVNLLFVGGHDLYE